MRLDIFSDFICPWCFIGKRRLEAAFKARSDVKFNINWQPFQLNSDMPVDGMDRQHYLSLKFGSTKNADDIYNNIKLAGKNIGINFQFEKITHTPNSSNAHRLAKYVKDIDPNALDNLVENLFNGYFIAGENIGDIGILSKIAASVGIDKNAAYDYLQTSDNVEYIKISSQQARHEGINGVPYFIFNEKYSISGAQEAEAFFPIFDLSLQDSMINSD